MDRGRQGQDVTHRDGRLWRRTSEADRGRQTGSGFDTVMDGIGNGRQGRTEEGRSRKGRVMGGGD